MVLLQHNVQSAELKCKRRSSTRSKNLTVLFCSGADVELKRSRLTGARVGCWTHWLALLGERVNQVSPSDGKFSWCSAQQPSTGPFRSLSYRRGRDGGGRAGSRPRGQPGSTRRGRGHRDRTGDGWTEEQTVNNL